MCEYLLNKSSPLLSEGEQLLSEWLTTASDPIQSLRNHDPLRFSVENTNSKPGPVLSGKVNGVGGPR
jgi:hypothetical protein